VTVRKAGRIQNQVTTKKKRNEGYDRPASQDSNKIKIIVPKRKRNKNWEDIGKKNPQKAPSSVPRRGSSRDHEGLRRRATAISKQEDETRTRKKRGSGIAWEN